MHCLIVIVWTSRSTVSSRMLALTLAARLYNSNFELTIHSSLGMTGIPEGDVREHESTKKTDSKPAQHGSSSTLNHPASLPVTNNNLVPPNLMAHGLMRPHHPPNINIPPPPFMMPPSISGMPPPLPGMPPFALPTSLPGTVQPPLPINPAAVISRTPQLDLVKRAAAAVQQPPLPNKAPLFPAAIASGSIPPSASLPPAGIALPPNSLSSLSNETDVNKTNGTSANAAASEPVNKIVNPLNGKIIHPEDDLSLEELRARLPKYEKTKLVASATTGGLLGNNHHFMNAPPPLLMNNLINNYSRSYTNDSATDNSISQPCYTTPVNDHSRSYHYRKS